MNMVAQFKFASHPIQLPFLKGKLLQEMVGEKKKAALVRTTEDFASRTSIHGVAYVFDREHSLVDRVLWILVVTSFLLLTGFFTAKIWTQWRDEQVRQLLLSYQ